MTFQWLEGLQRLGLTIVAGSCLVAVHISTGQIVDGRINLGIKFYGQSVV